MDVFISYSRKDEAIANSIYDSLLRDGCSVWLDKISLLPGQRWEYEIEEAIKKSNFVILLLSSHSVDKRGYFQKEVQLALDVYNTIPHGQIFLIPVRVDECDVPERLKPLQWVDLFPNWDEGIRLIRRSIYFQRTQDILAKSIEEQAPAPNDVIIVYPEADLDPKLRAFSGFWSGRWGGILPSQLIIENISSTKAFVVYTWGEPASGSFKSGWVRKEATVLPEGKIFWDRTSADATVSFEIDEVKDVVYGEHKQPQNVSRIAMKRKL